MHMPGVRPGDHFRTGPPPGFVVLAAHHESRATTLYVGRESRLRANISPATFSARHGVSTSPNAQLRSGRGAFRSAARQCHLPARIELPAPAEFRGVG